MLLGLWVGLIVTTFGILGFDLSYLPGDFGDTRFNIYILEHAHQYFFLDNVPTDSYWNAPIFYPQESAISFSDNLLGTFFFYSIFRFIGADVYTSFQLWMILITILNYLSAYYFFSFLLKNKYSAVLGAFIFAFSIALIGQYSHPQTYPRFCIPIAFFFAVKFFKEHKVEDLFGLMFFVVYQFYCVIYLGFMLAVPLIIFVLLTFLFQRVRILRKLTVLKLLGYLSGLIVNLLLLMLLLIPYMNSPIRRKDGGKIIYRTYEEVFHTLPTLKSYFFNNGDTIFWNFLNHTAKDLNKWWNHELFVGSLCIIAFPIIGVYLLKWLKKGRKVNKVYYALGIAGILTFSLYLRTETTSLYKYVFDIQGFSAIRALSRIINIELLFFGLMVGVAFKLIFYKVKRQKWAFLFVLIALVLDNFLFPSSYITFSKQEARNRVEQLREELKGVKKGDLFSFEPAIKKDKTVYYHIDAMLIAQELGLKTMNGYSSTVPFGYYYYAINPNEKTREMWQKKNNNKEEPTIVNGIYDPELKRIIAKIKNSKDWLLKIKEQSEKKKIPLEQGIVENAIWIGKENEKKKNE